MIAKNAAQHSGRWDILLADLALILFVVTLGGLVSMPVSEAAEQPQLDIAPSQALYRTVEGGPGLDEWLLSQPLDPRATLTIFVEYQPESASVSFGEAALLIEQANAAGVRVRTVIEPAQQSYIYASLAFDAVR